MRIHAFAAIPLVLAVSSTSLALPFDGHVRGFTDGANHHVGDAGFVAAHHRAPTTGDSEAERMHAHLAYIRDELGRRPASRPELAAKRAELLGYLDEYIEKGITPKNAHLPWRTPVFIDDGGAICAVGYLIERSAGRAVPEAVARSHRYDLLEDIAAAMPEVRDWIGASGFTLEELASIQPGYIAPVASTWAPWPASKRLPDGPYVSENETDGIKTTGAVRAGKMEGEWIVSKGARLLGSGTFTAGKGTWRSVYLDGKTMAEGPYAANAPDGPWRFYHPSGNLAAEGMFHGVRAGAWRFFYDTKDARPIAEGGFSGAAISGEWHHWDSSGHLLATSTDATPSGWSGSDAYLLDIVRGTEGVHHWVHQGNIMGDHHRLDMLSDGSEPLFVPFESGAIYDADGHKLAKTDGHWTSRDCDWNNARKKAAHALDLTTLHGLTSRTGGKTEICGPARSIDARRARHVEAMVASLDAVRDPSPDFVRQLALGETTIADAAAGDESAKKEVETSADLAKVLAANMTWYVEWPHVDGRFIQVFPTLPGYAVSSPY